MLCATHTLQPHTRSLHLQGLTAYVRVEKITKPVFRANRTSTVALDIISHNSGHHSNDFNSEV